MEIERGSTRSFSVENSLWKKPRAFPKPDNRINNYRSFNMTFACDTLNEINRHNVIRTGNEYFPQKINMVANTNISKGRCA
jgi:hypothetical protein